MKVFCSGFYLFEGFIFQGLIYLNPKSLNPNRQRLCGCTSVYESLHASARRRGKREQAEGALKSKIKGIEKQNQGAKVKRQKVP
jgi:hypothetical protein